ncbi:UNVERIFIED_CONTAM: hypothetical protein HDU68_006188 [Siphonaria sp. JEL0065]|nr:hypothetical protein HDU68_006188 [Siphonaria sp. JEL0065]
MALPVSTITACVVLVVFIYLNHVVPSEVGEALLSVLQFTILFVIRAGTPWVVLEYLKFPVEGLRMHLHFQTETVLNAVINLSFPETKSVATIIVVMVLEVGFTAIASLFLYRPYVEWMQTHHQSRLQRFMALVFRVIPMKRNQIRVSTMNTLATHNSKADKLGSKVVSKADFASEPALTINTEDEWDWLDSAKKELVLRMWANMNVSGKSKQKTFKDCFMNRDP